MEIITTITESYGIAGIVLVAILMVLFVLQLVLCCRRLVVSRFKLSEGEMVRQSQPAVSVVVPLFGEDEEYLKDGFRALLSQNCPNYEVVTVYVGKEDAFYATLKHMRKFYPHLKTTQINYSPQYPVSVKMALNIGIKSANYECVVITTPETRPTTQDWVTYMARGFMFGNIVLGYCNWERTEGLKNLFFRKYRLSESITWLAEAIRGRVYGATRNTLGFTKELYFGVRGFDHLDLNAGEDDLFVQRIAATQSVGVLLTPHAHCTEYYPMSFKSWLTEIYRAGQTRQFYSDTAKNAESCELISRVAFFVATIGAMAILPLELKAFALLLLLVRYIVVSVVTAKCAKRVGETAVAAWEPLFDFIEPWVRLVIRATQPKRITEWR